MTFVAVAATALGLAAPAFAEDDRGGTMSSWYNGDKSGNWTDRNTDGAQTRSTVAAGCTQEFTGRIRRVKNNAPDETVKSEHIDCYSYADAVNAGDVAKGTYHFSITDLTTVCHSGSCTVFPTSGSYHLYW